MTSLRLPSLLVAVSMLVPSSASAQGSGGDQPLCEGALCAPSVSVIVPDPLVTMTHVASLPGYSGDIVDCTPCLPCYALIEIVNFHAFDLDGYWMAPGAGPPTAGTPSFVIPAGQTKSERIHNNCGVDEEDSGPAADLNVYSTMILPDGTPFTILHGSARVLCHCVE